MKREHVIIQSRRDYVYINIQKEPMKVCRSKKYWYFLKSDFIICFQTFRDEIQLNAPWIMIKNNNLRTTTEKKAYKIQIYVSYYSY